MPTARPRAERVVWEGATDEAGVGEFVESGGVARAHLNGADDTEPLQLVERGQNLIVGNHAPADERDLHG